MTNKRKKTLSRILITLFTLLIVIGLWGFVTVRRSFPQTKGTVSIPGLTDEVEISDAARLVDQARAVPEIRQDRVDAIRVQIAEGTYETPEKLDTAVERLLDEIA